MKTIFISVSEYLRNKGELHRNESFYITHKDYNYILIGSFQSYDLKNHNNIFYRNNQTNEIKNVDKENFFVEIEVTPIYVAI